MDLTPKMCALLQKNWQKPHRPSLRIFNLCSSMAKWNLFVSNLLKCVELVYNYHLASQNPYNEKIKFLFLKQKISRYFIFKPERAVGVAVVGKAAGV